MTSFTIYYKMEFLCLLLSIISISPTVYRTIHTPDRDTLISNCKCDFDTIASEHIRDISWHIGFVGVSRVYMHFYSLSP